MMKQIKVKFVDFNFEFVPDKSRLYLWLSEWYDVELSDTPDYLFFSVFGNEHLRYNDCVKIFWTGENQSPDFNLCDYAIGFDRLDFGDRYLRLPLYMLTSRESYEAMMRRVDFTADDLKAKQHFCSFVYSNNKASAERQDFFDLLSRYKPVRSGGRYLNNVGGPVADKLAFQQTHKFAIAFENTSYPGYTTEKLKDAFQARTIPIYWGDPSVTSEFNPRSFINCADYPTFDAVVERVRQLDQDDDAYLAMMHECPLNNPLLWDDYHERFHAFVSNIFDQPVEAAKRYSRHYWGQKLVKHRLQETRAFDRSLYGLMLRFYMKFIYRRSRHGGNALLYRLHLALMRFMGR